MNDIEFAEELKMALKKSSTPIEKDDFVASVMRRLPATNDIADMNPKQSSNINQPTSIISIIQRDLILILSGLIGIVIVIQSSSINYFTNTIVPSLNSITFNGSEFFSALKNNIALYLNQMPYINNELSLIIAIIGYSCVVFWLMAESKYSA